MVLARLGRWVGLPLAGALTMAAPAVAEDVDAPVQPAAPAVVDVADHDGSMQDQLRRVHERMMSGVPGMADMHEQLTNDLPHMADMHQRMTGDVDVDSPGVGQ